MFSKSPSFARKGHQQLTGSDADEKDRIIAGVQFCVRYVGSTEVASVNGTGSGKTEIPVAKVFEQQRKKSDGKALKKMIMTICSKSLSVSEEASGKLVAHFPIGKITFCNVDTVYEKAFVFIARDRAESPFKAFVFTCESKAKAREAFKGLSLGFTINFESHQASRLVRGSANGEDAFFNGMAETTGEMKAGEKPKEEQQRQNGLESLPKESSVPHQNGFISQSNQGGNPSSLAPVQHRKLLEVVDNHRGRSVSDPFNRTKAFPVILSHQSPKNAASNPSFQKSATKKGDEVDDAEFTEFAELRSKSRSNTTIESGNRSGNFSEGFPRYDSAPSVWGGFQNTCLPIH